jgi:hypothetical protein
MSLQTGAGELFTQTPAPGGEAGKPEQVHPGRQLLLPGPGPGFRLQVCVGRGLWVVVVLVVVYKLSAPNMT